MIRVSDQCNRLGIPTTDSIDHEKLAPSVKSAVISYMNQRKFVTAASSARITDFIGNHQQVEEFCRVDYSDGLYSWSAHDIYYFEKYSIKLNDSFIDHVLKQSI